MLKFHYSDAECPAMRRARHAQVTPRLGAVTCDRCLGWAHDNMRAELQGSCEHPIASRSVWDMFNDGSDLRFYCARCLSGDVGPLTIPQAIARAREDAEELYKHDGTLVSLREVTSIAAELANCTFDEMLAYELQQETADYPLPDGCELLDLNDPHGTHNAVADALGEPRI